MSEDKQTESALQPPERIWIRPTGYGSIWSPVKLHHDDAEYARVAGGVATVDRSLYSELIKIAAELVRADGFLSEFADDMPPRLKRADVLLTASRQAERLKDWAYRVRQVADKLSAATAPIAAPMRIEDLCSFCEHPASDHARGQMRRTEPCERPSCCCGNYQDAVKRKAAINLLRESRTTTPIATHRLCSNCNSELGSNPCDRCVVAQDEGIKKDT